MTDTASETTRALPEGSEPATPVAARPPAPVTAAPLPGGSLGRYLVIEELGRGGMGLVLRAYDPKLQREVAIKLLRSGVLDATSEARMIHEARAMAKLSHPNVVAVYDVELGLASGVLVVMEYVAGGTLRQWLRAPRRWTEIVDAFVAAGRGLAAAHAKDLLHRDFKPANVLVTEDARIKVTDFGLAKFEGQESPHLAEFGISGTESAVLTQVGAVMGTPRYMAPEQHTNKELDARTDQYAFCLALWEALTGTPPFAGHDLNSYAQSKSAGPAAWPKGLPIPAYIRKALTRGLAVDRTQRWPTMDELLAVLGKSRDHRRKQATLGVGAALLAGSLWWTATASGDTRCTGAQAHLRGIWDSSLSERVHGAIQATGLAYADIAWTRTEAQLSSYAEAWVNEHTEACQATSVRGEQSTEILDLRMACLHQAKVGLAAVVGQLSQADDQSWANAHKVVDGLPPLARCADIEALVQEVPRPNDAVAAAVESTMIEAARAAAKLQAGHYDDALKISDDLREGAGKTDYAPLLTEVLRIRGAALAGLGRAEDAAVALKQALHSALAGREWARARDLANLIASVVGDDLGRASEGLAYADLAWGLLGRQPAKIAEARVRSTIGKLKMNQGRYAEAEDEQRRALSLILAEPSDPALVMVRTNLGNILQIQGKYEEAEAEQRLVLALRTAALGPKHPEAINARNNLSTVLFAGGKRKEAAEEQEAVLSLRLATSSADHPNIASSRSNLGLMLLALGRNAEAEEQQRAALALRMKVLPPDHPHFAFSYNNLGEALAAQGKHAEAEREHRRALALRLTILAPDHPHIALSRTNLAKALRAQKIATDEALALALAAWSRRMATDIPNEDRAEAAFLLAQLLRERGQAADKARARLLGETARDAYAAAGPAYAASRSEVEAWLRRPQSRPRTSASARG